MAGNWTKLTVTGRTADLDGITAVNGQKGGTFKMPTVNGISMRADNLNEESGIDNWQNKHPIDESYGFIST